ncbi:unnamed protein product, partial [marine sediment metagenome]
MLAAFLWQNTACAASWSYKGDTPLGETLDPLFDGFDRDIFAELVKYTAVAAVTSGLGYGANYYAQGAGFWGSAAAYGTAGAIGGGFSAYMYDGDIGQGMLIGGVTGGITGGVSSMTTIPLTSTNMSGGWGAAAGAGIGTVA